MAETDDQKMPEIINKAMIIQYIINYAVGLIGDYNSMYVLELQPTIPETTGGNLSFDNTGEKNTALLWTNWRKQELQSSDDKHYVPGVTLLRTSKKLRMSDEGEEKKNCGIDVKSVDEVAGSIQDLNSSYQMVFIGLNAARINQDEKQITQYNYLQQGSIYKATGDKANGSGETYSPVDITKQFEKELVEFMEAGYPIVVEDAFFKNSSLDEEEVKFTAKGETEEERNRIADLINTDYVSADSVMYDFIRLAVKDYNNYIYTISDVHTDSTSLNVQLNIKRPYIQVDTVSPPTKNAEDGKIYASITYKLGEGINGSGKDYNGTQNLNFYLDTNYDGLFQDGEKLLSTTPDGSNKLEVCMSDYFYSLSGGVIPWKLEYASSNKYQRSSITGDFVFNNEKDDTAEVKLLQISDSANNDATTNLEYLLSGKKEVRNRLLRFYLESSGNQAGVEYKAKTMTPAKVAEELNANPDFLLGYDLLVLGLGSDGIGNNTTIMTAVGSYIDAGKAAVLLNNKEAAFGTAILNQREAEKTYVGLGKELDYFKYLNESAANVNTKYIKMANSGTVTSYPFNLGDDVLLENEHKASTMLLDQTKNSKHDDKDDSGNDLTNVTVWYTYGASNNEGANSAYAQSPKDTRNNYYLYSKGNVYYLDEKAFDYTFVYINEPDDLVDTPEGNEAGTKECQLFANCLYAAYNAGIKNPQVKIVAGYSKSAPEIRSISIAYDNQVITPGSNDTKGTAVGETTDIFFKYQDYNNTLKTKAGLPSIKVYYELGRTKIVDNSQEGNKPGGYEKAVTVDNGVTLYVTGYAPTGYFTVEENALVPVAADYSLKKSQVYMFKAPVLPLQNLVGASNADYYIEVESATKTKTGKTLTGGKNVSLVRTQLFLLE